MSARRPPHSQRSGAAGASARAARRDGLRARPVRLFIAAHVGAAALIYGIAVLVGGGLGGAPWPANELVLRRVPMPKAAPAAPTSARGAPADTPDDRPRWLAQRPDELPMRAVPELRPRSLDRAP